MGDPEKIRDGFEPERAQGREEVGQAAVRACLSSRNSGSRPGATKIHVDTTNVRGYTQEEFVRDWLPIRGG